MTITISSEDPRSIKAIEIAAGASQWLRCHTADGAKAYGIPSQCQPGRFYLVTCASCDCPDAQRHQGRACKHQFAVRLHCTLIKAQEAQPKRRRLSAVPALPATTPQRADIFDRFNGD